VAAAAAANNDVCDDMGDDDIGYINVGNSDVGVDGRQWRH
jgi:hypothetical protein